MDKKRQEKKDLIMQLNFDMNTQTRLPYKLFGAVRLLDAVKNEKDIERASEEIEQTIKQVISSSYTQVLDHKKQSDIMGQHMELMHGVPQKKFFVEPFDLMHANVRGQLESRLYSMIGPLKSVDIGYNVVEVLHHKLNIADELDDLYVFCVSYNAHLPHCVQDVVVSHVGTRFKSMQDK